MPARTLIIEDDETNLYLLRHLLEANGHETLSARDGVEGIEAARREQPGLILCDIRMPEMDGLEFCRQLKSDASLCRIPLVAVTASAMVGDREKLLAAGFDGYISKPINPETLIGQMNLFAYGCGGMKAPAPSVSPDNLPMQRTSEATILVVDDNPEHNQLTRAQLEPFGYKVLTAKSARDALALARETRPDLILSDLNMPGGSGFDLLKEIKTDRALSSIPLIILSCSASWRSEGYYAAGLGAAAFILRPVDAETLCHTIELALCPRESSSER